MRLLPNIVAVALGLAVAGCSDLTNQPLPAGTSDPSNVNNAAGARGMAAAARSQFQYVMATYIPTSGLLTDELEANGRGVSQPNGGFPDPVVAVDARLLPQGTTHVLATDLLYAMLQQARGLANQAIGALLKYDADTSIRVRGELYAQEGYAELLLADLYCSGVPLSTWNFHGDFTYKPGSTTDEVYAHAIALFDTALTLAGDSAPVAGFAKIGKARALLATGKYADAATAVSDVSPAFQYTQAIYTCDQLTFVHCSRPAGQAVLDLAYSTTVADSEGIFGLPFRSSGDPRSAVLPDPVGIMNDNDVWFPMKYTFGGVSTIVVASGVEAQLIAAEADLQSGGSAWLGILNALRTDGTNAPVYTRLCQNGMTAATGQPEQDGSPCPAGVVDVQWGPGIGAPLIPAAALAKSTPTCPKAEPPGLPCTDTTSYIGLPPLTDPGSPDARRAMLLRERAFWLFLTGTRQGDLRRAVRQYHLSKTTLYPNGSYRGVGSYGSNIDASIPQTGSYSESPNPYFRGCLSRD